MTSDRPLIDFLVGVPQGLDGSAQAERARRLTLLGLLLLNCLVVAICVALLVNARTAAVASAQVETLNDARLIERAASGLFDKAALAIGAVGSQIERQLSGPGLDAQILWPIVDAHAALVPEIERIGVFDARGAQLCGLPAGRCRHLDIADRDYFVRLREHPEDPITLYGPYESRLDDRPALVLARALRLEGGRFGGVVIAVLPQERLRRLVATGQSGPGDVISLRTTDLRLVVRQPGFTGQGAADASQRISDALRAAVAASPAEGVYRAVAPDDGVERVAAYRRLEQYPLYVLVGQAKEDFLVGWYRQAAWTAGFLVLFGLVSWQLARATSTSLRRHAQSLRLYDEAPCGYHTLDPSGTYLSVNATELAWLGCARQDVVGKLKPTDFFTDEGLATFAANFPVLKRTGRLAGLELELVGRDGTVRHVLVNATAVRDAGGAFLHSNSVMQDISALHEARTRLDVLARQQSAMLDNDLIGIVKFKDRRTVWKNHAMDRIFGYTGHEWDDMPSRTLFFDDEAHGRASTELRAALQQNLTYRSQLPMRRKDGSEVWIDASGSMVGESTGELMMMLADISPIKAAEQSRLRAAVLEAQNFQLRETSRLKSEFVANMSHELRTPLNAILGFGRMLQAASFAPGSPKYARFVSGIVVSGERLLALIDQVLDYARVESGRMAFDPVPVSVAQVLDEVVDLLRADCAARRIDVRTQVDDGCASVLADPLRLSQMLLALIGNAVKFSHDGGGVEVTASGVDETFWQVAVTDHGIGIEESNLSRLFGPFVQLSTGSSRVYGGTGVGLALVRSMAEAQGGRIEVRSQLGKGSTFTLTLPRSPASTAGDV